MGLIETNQTFFGCAGGDKGEISRANFDAYFDGCDEGFTIVLDKPRAFKRDVSLRDIGVGQAPQGYRYVDRIALEVICRETLE